MMFKTAFRLAILLLTIGILSRGSLAADKVKWEPVGLSGGGSMFCGAYSPLDHKLIMMNSDMSNVFLSHDGGHTWEMINQSQLRDTTRCNPAFHPTDVNVIFAAQAGAGLKVSRDKGVTFQQVQSVPKDAKGHFIELRGQIAIDPGQPDRMMIGDDSGVLLSNDGSKSWTRCEGPAGLTLGFHFDQTSPAAKRTIFAATTQGVWRSDDSGRTWKALGAPIAGRKIMAFAGGSNAKSATAIIYCSVEATAEGDKYVGGVFRSSDRSATWENVMTEGINKDTKPGDQWAEHSVDQYLYVLTTDVNPKIVYAVDTGAGAAPPHAGSVYRSDDAGKSWRSVFQPNPRFKSFNVTDKDYWVAKSGNYFVGTPHSATIDPVNPDRLMRTQSNLLLTDDGGKSWSYGNARQTAKTADVPTFECTGIVVTTAHRYYADPAEPTRRYICYTDIGFAVSRDSDKSWSWWGKSATPWGNTTYELAFDPKVPGKVWAACSGVHDIPNANIVQENHKDSLGGGGVCVSTDHCDTWTAVPTVPKTGGLPADPVVSIVMDPKSPVGNRTLYASSWHNGVYKSVDDGKTWAKTGAFGNPKRMYPCQIVLHDDGTLFVVSTGRKHGGTYITDGPGVYRSKDAGKTWELANKGQAFAWPKDITVDPKDSKIIYVGAANAGQDQDGLWRTTDGGATWTRILRAGHEHFGSYLHPHRPGWIYATLCESPDQCGLYLSKDNGKTFKPMMGLPFSNVQRVTVDPNNDDAIYVSTFGGSVFHGPAQE
jgi:photosystem II stability/assembly factor-like uncharacterized protein